MPPGRPPAASSLPGGAQSRLPIRNAAWPSAAGSLRSAASEDLLGAGNAVGTSSLKIVLTLDGSRVDSRHSFTLNPFTGGAHGDCDESPMADERPRVRILQLRLRLWLQLRRLPELEGRQLPRARRLLGDEWTLRR